MGQKGPNIESKTQNYLNLMIDSKSRGKNMNFQKTSD